MRQFGRVTLSLIFVKQKMQILRIPISPSYYMTQYMKAPFKLSRALQIVISVELPSGEDQVFTTHNMKSSCFDTRAVPPRLPSQHGLALDWASHHQWLVSRLLI